MRAGDVLSGLPGARMTPICSLRVVETGLGQVDKLPGARAVVRLSCASRTGKLGKDCADGKVEERCSRSDRAGTARMVGET